jgi:Flp pilus assembly protein TadD
MHTITRKITEPPSATDTQQLLYQAWQSCGNGHFEQSERLCKRLAENQPGNAEVLHLKALVRWHFGDRTEAISLLMRAIENQPGQPLHYNNLGVFLTQSGCYDKAAAVLEKAVALSPRDTDARCNLGLAWFHQNRLTAAAQCFRECDSGLPGAMALRMPTWA